MFFETPTKEQLAWKHEYKSNEVEYVHKRYGKVTLEIITKFEKVKKFRFENAPKEAIIPMDTIEKVVLITGNRRLQPTFNPDFKQTNGCFLIFRCLDECAVVKVKELEFPEGVDAREVLVRPTSGYGFYTH
jgi:hypothetical protein